MKTRYLINNYIDVYLSEYADWQSFTLNTGSVVCRLYKHYDEKDIEHLGVYQINIVSDISILNTKKFLENL